MDAFLSELFDIRGVDYVPFLDPITGGLSHDSLMRDERLIDNAAFRYAWRILSGGALPSARCFAEYNASHMDQRQTLASVTDWMLTSPEGPFHLMRDTALMHARAGALRDGRFDAAVKCLRDASSKALHRMLVEKLLDRYGHGRSDVEPLMMKSLFAAYTELTSQAELVSTSVQLTNPASGMVASHQEEHEHLSGCRAAICRAPQRVGRGDAMKRRFSQDLHWQRRQFGKPYLSAPPDLMDLADVVRAAIGSPWVVNEKLDAAAVERHAPVIASSCVRLHHISSSSSLRPPSPSASVSAGPTSILILCGEGDDAECGELGRKAGYQRILRVHQGPASTQSGTSRPLVYSLYYQGRDHWSYGILARCLRRHLETPCPLESLSPAHAHLLVDRCLTRLALSHHILSHDHQVFTVSRFGAAQRVVLAVDTRADPSATVLALTLTLSSLSQPSDWAVRVMCARRNRSEFERMLRPLCPEASFDDSSPELNVETFDVETSYNALMKNPATWLALLPSDVVLTVQDDGLLVRPGVEGLMDDVLYLGAPWGDTPCNAPLKTLVPSLVGNGGLSLRNVRAMLAISVGVQERECRRLFHTRIEVVPEDVMYAALAAQPDQLIKARAFSCEAVQWFGALGFHKSWPYWPVTDTHSFMLALMLEADERVSAKRQLVPPQDFSP